MRSKDARKARKITRRDTVKHGRLRRSGDPSLKLPLGYRDHYVPSGQFTYDVEQGSWSDLFERRFGPISHP